MTIRKMTLAAALTVGLLAGTMGVTFADTSVVTGGACPLNNNCPRIVTPENSICSKCNQKKSDCGCQKEEKRLDCDTEVMALDSETSDDCGCEKPKKEKKQKCKKEKEQKCEKPKADKPCTKCDEPDLSCNDVSMPAMGICPNTACEAKSIKHQTYAYPAAIYGENVTLGESNNGVYIDNTAMGSNLAEASGIGIDVALEGEGITGAALPCVNSEIETINGISVQRDCSTLDAKCPINISTETSMDALKKTMVPFDYSQEESMTGAAMPLVSVFDDVPEGYWAGCDINKLAENNIIAGYPDRTFKPTLPVSRAEFASMAVKGFNLDLDKTPSCTSSMFKDVPNNFWANQAINTSVKEGLMAGYPNDTFKPNHPVSRAEALTILAKGVKCEMDSCKAQNILNQYCDGKDVPQWAQIPVAKSLEAGAIAKLPNPNQIMPMRDASRADLASMLEQIRIAGGYSNNDIASVPCDTCTGGAAYLEKTENITLPTLKICFDDEISARTSHVGDQFAAKTIDAMTVNGVTYPAGSVVRGKILQVDRPAKCDDGAIKLSFDTIEHCDCKSDLPQQILTAQVNKSSTPNAVARFFAWPFTTVGQVVGTAGRTVGGAAIALSNAFESVSNGVGVGTAEMFQGQFRAGGRSYQDAGKNLFKAPIDLTRTALSGTLGMFQVTGDEMAYLVDPSGKKIAKINPKESVTIAFGCNGQ